MLLDYLCCLATRPRTEATGVVMTDADVPADVEAARVRRVARQLQAGGLRQVFMAGTPSFCRRH